MLLQHISIRHTEQKLNKGPLKFSKNTNHLDFTKILISTAKNRISNHKFECRTMAIEPTSTSSISQFPQHRPRRKIPAKIILHAYILYRWSSRFIPVWRNRSVYPDDQVKKFRSVERREGGNVEQCGSKVPISRMAK
jgi:hypothetical protein